MSVDVHSSELNAIDSSQRLLINKMMQRQWNVAQQKREKAESKMSVGRSMYEFPTIKEIEEFNERSA